MFAKGPLKIAHYEQSLGPQYQPQLMRQPYTQTGSTGNAGQVDKWGKTIDKDQCGVQSVNGPAFTNYKQFS